MGIAGCCPMWGRFPNLPYFRQVGKPAPRSSHFAATLPLLSRQAGPLYDFNKYLLAIPIPLTMAPMMPTMPWSVPQM